jgi:hypothetical protein
LARARKTNVKGRGRGRPRHTDLLLAGQRDAFFEYVNGDVGFIFADH